MFATANLGKYLCRHCYTERHILVCLGRNGTDTSNVTSGKCLRYRQTDVFFASQHIRNNALL